MRFHDHIHAQLADLERRDLLRRPRTATGPQGPVLKLDGREVLCFCSNNYLGLANHPDLARAAAQAFSRLGVGAGASRHVAGSEQTHLAAQARLAEFVSLPSALLLSTGYAANVGAIQALLGPDDLVFSDEYNHASLIDGCRLSRARVHRFAHRDYEALAQLLQDHRSRGQAALIVTEAVFSMDGTLADLSRLRALADLHGCGLLVDEAHSLGLLGPGGAGLCVAQGVVPDVLTGMLGKAFGAQGAFVAGKPELVHLVENRARSYVFSTAPAPALAAAALAAADLVQAADARRAAVHAHAAQLRSGLRALGFNLPEGCIPILPIYIGSARATMALSDRLFERGVFVHGIRPPTVPEGSSRLRLAPMATHTEEHVKQALRVFSELRPVP